MTQNEALAAYLQRNKQITPMEALPRLGIYRLAARVYDLRQKGWDIHTITMGSDGTAFARYVLVATPEAQA